MILMDYMDALSTIYSKVADFRTAPNHQVQIRSSASRFLAPSPAKIGTDSWRCLLTTNNCRLPSVNW